MVPPSDVSCSFIVSPSPAVIYQSGVIFTTAILPSNIVTIPFVPGYQKNGARKLTQGPVIMQKGKSAFTFYLESLKATNRGMVKYVYTIEHNSDILQSYMF